MRRPAALALLALLVAAPAPARAQSEPIRVVFDLHCDPIQNDLPLAKKQEVYQSWLDNLEWTLDETEPYGVQFGFGASGSFLEFVVDEGPDGRGAELLRRLYERGGMIGSHSHEEYRRGTHDWPDTSSSNSERIWGDSLEWAERGIDTVFGGELPEALESILDLKEHHFPLTHAEGHALMLAFDLGICPRGTQSFHGWYDHHVWSPLRCSSEGPLVEDLSTPYVKIPAGGVIGISVSGVEPDAEPDALFRRQFLQLYLNRRACERAGDDRVWVFNFAAHAHDLTPDSPTRRDLLAMAEWLASGFGSGTAAWNSYRDVKGAFVEWETRHPGASSFDHPSEGVDWDQYPYLPAVATELAGTRWRSDLAPGPGVLGCLLEDSDGRSVWVLWSTGRRPSVDLAALTGAASVETVDLETGATRVRTAGRVVLGKAAILVRAGG